MKRLKDATILVVGLGQIGGSMALCLRQNGSVSRVIGFDSRSAVLKRALSIGAIDESTRSLKKAASEADVVILSTPIREIARLLPSIQESVRTDALCLDVASTKTDIIKTAEECKFVNFVGGHPLAGTEVEGLDGASADKFAGKLFILTPSLVTSKAAMRLAKELVSTLGSEAHMMNAKDHDDAMAFTSGLPHSIALALAGLSIKKSGQAVKSRQILGGSFLGATRVAQSPVHLVSELLMTNRSAVKRMVSEFIGELNTINRILGSGNERSLVEYVGSAHRAAAQMHKPAKPRKRGVA